MIDERRPALVCAVLTASLVAASHAFLAPERGIVDTLLRALAGALVAFGLMRVLLRLSR